MVRRLLVNRSPPPFSNVFEEVTKFLAQNAYPQSGSNEPLLSKHFHCLDALLSAVDSIERNCLRRRSQQGGTASSISISSNSVGDEATWLRECAAVREMKRLIDVGSHLFNECARDGVEFLFQKGVFNRAADVVDWFRRGASKLDKAQIANYLCR